MNFENLKENETVKRLIKDITNGQPVETLLAVEIPDELAPAVIEAIKSLEKIAGATVNLGKFGEVQTLGSINGRPLVAVMADEAYLKQYKEKKAEPKVEVKEEVKKATKKAERYFVGKFVNYWLNERYYNSAEILEFVPAGEMPSEEYWRSIGHKDDYVPRVRDFDSVVVMLSNGRICYPNLDVHRDMGVI